MIQKANYKKENLKTGILHLGIGRFQRAHQAFYYHQALQKGRDDLGVVGVSFRSDNAKKELEPRNFDYHLWVKDLESQVHEVSLLKDVLWLQEDLQNIIDIGCSKDLKAITLTITEKGYGLDHKGNLKTSLDWVQEELDQLDSPKSALGLLRLILKERSASDEGLAIISCDNVSENGVKLKKALLSFLDLTKDKELKAWISNNCSFPKTMVDRIVPATTSKEIKEFKSEFQIEDQGLVTTEAFHQWFIEDVGEELKKDLDLEEVIWTKNISEVEKMKLRLLNASHSFLAYRGQLAGHKYVHQAVNDKKIVFYIKGIYEEAMKTISLEGVDLHEYCDQLITRFRNPHLNHKLEQIAMDGTQKLPIRVTETIRERWGRGYYSPFLQYILLSFSEYLFRASQGDYKLSDPKAELITSLYHEGLSQDEVLHHPEILGFKS